MDKLFIPTFFDCFFSNDSWMHMHESIIMEKMNSAAQHFTPLKKIIPQFMEKAFITFPTYFCDPSFEVYNRIILQ